jgi:DEAD/DEAH box helicase domain-containing protein
LHGVVATNALELGIDVGGLDACILNGFPGTIASMWQQAGRAGRDERPSVAVLVGGSDQLDQWLMAHPRAVFTRPPEPAVVNGANPSVLLPQLACAAYEQPLRHADEQWWDDDLADGVRQLVLGDQLRVREGAAYWQGRGTPARGIGLRSGSPDEYRIAEADGRLVGTVDGSRAFEQVHPGAIYLHLGQQYKVVRLDLEERVALVEPVTVDEYTQVRSHLQVTIFGADDARPVGRAQLFLGAVEIATEVVGYQRHDSRSHRVLSREALSLPPSRLVTRAFWYTIDEDVLASARLDPEQVPGALHAAEHAGIGILPLFTICDRWDVGGVSTLLQADTGRPTIVIYDGYPGGVGIAELGFAAGGRHLEATRSVIERCPCQHGCPSCVQSPKCGNGNEPLDKAGAVALLRTILGTR